MSDQTQSDATADRPLGLLRTKLFIPRTHPDVVARPQLIQILNEVFERKVAIISAPAGSGKSTLLSSWVDIFGKQTSLLEDSAPSAQDNHLAGQTPRFAWVSLDDRENDPVRFWTYCIAALQTLQPETGVTALAMLQALQPPPVENFLTEILNDVAGLTGQVVLVLDDYHQIRAEVIHEGIKFLIENLPKQVHLVLSSRTNPPLPLPLYRVRRELVELNAGDLRFTPDEAAAFLNQVMRFDLSPENILALDRLTEGWIAGLQLAALSMKGAGDFQSFLGSFTGGHRYVFDYLAQEVLDRQPGPVRHFLIQTSILDRLQGDLCDAITGRLLGEKSEASQSTPGFTHGQEILLYLEKSNLFLVPLDPQRQWYRYHHLFSDFLRAKLEQEVGQPGIAGLHRQASEWFEEQGLVHEAVEQAFLAEDYERAAQLIRESAPDMFRNSELNALKDWLKVLPPALVSSDPDLSMVLSWALVATAETDTVEAHLQDIESQLGVAADGSAESLAQQPQVLGALAEISCIRASLAFNRLDIGEVIKLSEQARLYLDRPATDGLFNNRTSLRQVTSFTLAVVNEFSGEVLTAITLFNQIIPSELHLFPMALGHLAQLQILQGQLQQAEQTYHRALDWIHKRDRPTPLSGMIHTGLGIIQCERNELEPAFRSFQQGIEIGRPWNQWESLTIGYFGLARIKTAQRDLNGAKAALQELADTADRLKYGMALPAIRSQQALLAARQGEHEPVTLWLQDSQLPAEGTIPFWLEGEALIQARALICLGNPTQAVHLLERVLPSAEARHSQGRVIEILALRAAARSLSGEIQAAKGDLLRALALARPEGYMRIFLDEGEPLRRLLVLLSDEHGPLQGYIHDLISSFEPESSSFIKTQTKPRSKAKMELPPLAREAGIEPLSERELEVLRLIAGGLTNQEIADTLVISLNTVKTHVKNILAHLEASNRTEAIAHARQIGLI